MECRGAPRPSENLGTVLYSTVNRDCDFLLGSLLVSTLFSSHDGIIKNLIQSNINNDESVAST